MARLDPHDSRRAAAASVTGMTRATTLRAFVVRVVVLLPPSFAAWYFTAPYYAAILGPPALQFVEPWRVGLVTALERSGFMLSFVTSLETRSFAGEVGLLVAEVNPLLYTYGLALFVALMLGTRARAWKVFLGAAILLPFHAWGVAFDFLAQVGVLAGPDVAARAGLWGWQREAIAIGYQAGSLIFPSLVPVLLWAAFNRAFIAGLRPRAAQAAAPAGVRQRTDQTGVPT
jgi:hypothetical protein